MDSTTAYKGLYPDMPETCDKIKITSPQLIFDNFKWIFEGSTVEKFVVFWLNSQNKVFGFEIISQGSLDSSIVAPLSVFKSAIVSSAKSIILAHNHPSGNTEPSKEDIQITEILCDGGKILNIQIFDHLIFTDDNGYTSFLERRII